MLGRSRVEGLIMPLRRMAARPADVYGVQSSSLRTGVKETVTLLVNPSRGYSSPGFLTVIGYRNYFL
jgi:hypothetical protein